MTDSKRQAPVLPTTAMNWICKLAGVPPTNNLPSPPLTSSPELMYFFFSLFYF